MSTVVKLQRQNVSQPWGFRIHGGKDFNQPLIILKVTTPSLSSPSLTPGDLILRINQTDASSLTHKAAQELIKNSTQTVELTIVKGGTSTWKPSQSVGADGNVKTSLKKNGGGGGGAAFDTKSGVLINKQFNTPIQMYSEASIAETLSAQAEVLAGGAIGVNFKKNEKKYNYENSEVYKMLQEVENEPPGGGDDQQSSYGQQPQNSPALHRVAPTNYQAQHQQVARQQQQQQQQQSPKVQPQKAMPQQQQCAAPAPQQCTAAPQQQHQQCPAPTAPQQQQSSAQQQGNANICAECERLIVGVFCRIKDRNLHVDCFKCSTCGQSLKNVGYYNINNKLYCDIHAKLVARQMQELSPSIPQQSPAHGGKPFSYAPSGMSGSGQFNNAAAAAAALSGGGSGLQQQQPWQQQQQSSSSFSEFSSSETITKSSSSTAASSFDASKVTWPPLDQPITTTPLSAANNKQPASKLFKHVPYQPLGSLLQQSSAAVSNQSASSSWQQQNKITAPPQASPPWQQQQQQPQQQQITMSPIITTPPVVAPKPTFAPPPKPAFVVPQQSAFGSGPPPPQQSAGTPPGPSFGGGAAPGGGGAGGKSTSSNVIANRIGRGILNQPSSRVAMCGMCHAQIRGPFISTSNKLFCPGHFKCGACQRDLMEIGFVDIDSKLYCEFCWEKNLAPPCKGCGKRIKFECLKAMGQEWHVECFKCARCSKVFNRDPFFVEDGLPYCSADWNEMFTVRCFGCGFAIEAGDKWIEALNNNYHSQCFNCSACKKNLEGQSFFAKQGRPFCKGHAR